MSAPDAPDDVQVRSRRMLRSTWREPHPAVAFVVSMALLSGLWDLLRLGGVIPTAQTPTVEATIGAAVSGIADGSLLGPLGQTVVTAACGLAASVAIGLPIGLAMGRFRLVDEALGLTADALRPIPAVALVPVAVVVLGLGLQMQISLIAFAAVWPILFNARYGARNVEPIMVDAARLAGLSRWGIIRRVVVPASLPAVMTGVRLATSISVVLTVVTEIVASGTGLGNYVNVRQQVGDVEHAFAGVMLAALLGAAANSMVRLLENRVVSWHHSQQAAAR